MNGAHTSFYKQKVKVQRKKMERNTLINHSTLINFVIYSRYIYSPELVGTQSIE